MNWKNLRHDRPSTNVLEMIARSNNVGYWIARKILKALDKNARVKCLERFIEFADVRSPFATPPPFVFGSLCCICSVCWMDELRLFGLLDW
jgi:hypothetical protein